MCVQVPEHLESLSKIHDMLHSKQHLINDPI